MYVTITRTRDPLDQPLEIATIAGEEMLPWLQEIEGFDGLMMLSNAADGSTLVLSFWESEEIAEAHRVARAEFREKMTSAVNVHVEEVSGYELMFAHVGPRLVALEGA